MYLSTVQIGQPPLPRGFKLGGSETTGPELRMCVMTVSKLISFERFFDRSAVVFLLVLGAAAAGATAFVGL